MALLACGGDERSRDEEPSAEPVVADAGLPEVSTDHGEFQEAGPTDDGKSVDEESTPAEPAEEPGLQVPLALEEAVRRLGKLGYRPLNWLDPRNRFRPKQGSDPQRDIQHTSGTDSSEATVLQSIHHHVSPGRTWRGPGLNSERETIPLQLSDVSAWEVAFERETPPDGWPRRLHLSLWDFDDETRAGAAEEILNQHAHWVVATLGAKHPNVHWRQGQYITLARVDSNVWSSDLQAVRETLESEEGPWDPADPGTGPGLNH